MLFRLVIVFSIIFATQLGAIAADKPAARPASAPSPSLNAFRAHTADPDADLLPSTAAYRAIVSRMFNRMSIEFSGDVDKDFAEQMLPKGLATVDMVRTLSGFGKDAELREIANTIAKNRAEENRLLRDWLNKNVTPVKK